MSIDVSKTRELRAAARRHSKDALALVRQHLELLEENHPERTELECAESNLIDAACYLEPTTPPLRLVDAANS
jgi:hypothetical protein